MYYVIKTRVRVTLQLTVGQSVIQSASQSVSQSVIHSVCPSWGSWSDFGCGRDSCFFVRSGAFCVL